MEITTDEIIARVAADQLNWVRAKNLLKQRGVFTDEVAQQLTEAVTAAQAARNAADGYSND